MAFAYSRTRTWAEGAGRTSIGTFTNGAGDSGGQIATGLRKVEYFSASPESGTAVVSHTLNSPSNGYVTIVAATGVDGVWMARGRT